MADLEEIVENPREGGENPGGEGGRSSVNGNSTKRRRSRKHQNSSGSEVSVHSPASGQDPEERQKENGSEGKHSGQQTDGWKQKAVFTQQDPRGRFYEDYRKVADEYDREFMKQYDEDLTTTLIFAGLFSAVTSAFIIDIKPQLRSDTGEETAALLRVLIHKIDNTTFGNDPPALPQWTGPPHTIVQIQAILFASLAFSLFSAFLAMLGKQWLNRYALTDVRGTTIERSQNRQRKHDGIVGWYFNYVMESLPLMLQIALLLLGCALYLYLREISTTVASVVLGVTLFGAIFYLFVVAAGTFYEGCPYRTPGSRILRHILRHTLPSIIPALRSVPSAVSKSFVFVGSKRVVSFLKQNIFVPWWSSFQRPWYSPRNILLFFLTLCVLLARLAGIVIDTRQRTSWVTNLPGTNLPGNELAG